MAALVGATACTDAVGPVALRSAAEDALVVNTVTVTTTAELLAALSPENAGRRILLRSGTYDIDRPLTIPDGITPEGEGTMHPDGAGFPTGFGSSVHVTLQMTANVPDDMLTLGDGVTLRRLEVVDRTGRSGNVVAVYSRRPGDQVRGGHPRIRDRERERGLLRAVRTDPEPQPRQRSSAGPGRRDHDPDDGIAGQISRGRARQRVSDASVQTARPYCFATSHRL